MIAVIVWVLPGTVDILWIVPSVAWICPICHSDPPTAWGRTSLPRDQQQHPKMAELHPTPLDGGKREPLGMSQQESEEGFETDLADLAPAYMRDSEELAATQAYKRAMLDDAASSTSFRQGGARLPRVAQVCRRGRDVHPTTLT